LQAELAAERGGVAPVAVPANGDADDGDAESDEYDAYGDDKDEDE